MTPRERLTRHVNHAIASGAPIVTESPTRDAVLLRIAQLQAIQKTHKPSESAWIIASGLLVPLFARMAELDRATPPPQRSDRQ